jgi:hypothetical protein
MAFFVSNPYAAPGFRSIPDISIEELLVHPDEGAMFKKGVQLAKGYPMVKVGDVLSMITANGVNKGKYRRYTGSGVSTAQVTGDSTFTFKDQTSGNPIAPPFIPGEIINIGAITNKTVSSVNPANGHVTISGTFGGTVNNNDVVSLATSDGSDVAAGIAARPIFPRFYDPLSTTTQVLLDDDYLVDVIWQGILRLSVIRGLDAGAITDLRAVSLQPFMDAVQIR